MPIPTLGPVKPHVYIRFDELVGEAWPAAQAKDAVPVVRGVITDPLTEETSVPGVYVAGDVSRNVLLVAVAVGEGAKAAIAINKALLIRDGLCD